VVVEGLRRLVRMDLEVQPAAARKKECDLEQSTQRVTREVASMVKAVQARKKASATDDIIDASPGAGRGASSRPTTAVRSGVLLVRVATVSNLPMPARSQCCHLSLRVGSQCCASRPPCASSGGATVHQAYGPVHRFGVEASKDVRMLEISVQSSASDFGHVLVDIHGDKPNQWHEHTCTLEDYRTGKARKGDVTFEVNFVYDPFDPSAEALVRRFDTSHSANGANSQMKDTPLANMAAAEDRLLEDLSVCAPANILAGHLWQAVQVRSQHQVEQVFRRQLNAPASLSSSDAQEARQAGLARRAFARQARLARPLDAKQHARLPVQVTGQDEEHKVLVEAINEDFLYSWPSTSSAQQWTSRSTRPSSFRDPLRPLLPWIIQELKDPRHVPLFTSRRQARMSAMGLPSSDSKAAALASVWEEVARKRQEDRENYARPWRLQQAGDAPSSPSRSSLSEPSRFARLQTRLRALLEETGKALKELHASMQRLAEEDHSDRAAAGPVKRILEICRRLDAAVCLFQDFSSQVEVLQVIIQQVETMVAESSITESPSKREKGAKREEEAWQFCAGLAQLEVMGAEAAWQAQLNLRDLRAEEDAVAALLLRESTPLTSVMQDFIATRPTSAFQTELDELDGEVLETFGSALRVVASMCAAAGLDISVGDPVSASGGLAKDRWAPLTVSVKAAAKKWEVASPRLLRWARSSPVPGKPSGHRQTSAVASSDTRRSSGRHTERRSESPVLPSLPGHKVYMKRGCSGWVHVADSVGDHSPSSWPAADTTPPASGSLGAHGASGTSAPAAVLPQLGSRLWTPGGGPGAWPLSPSLLRSPRVRDAPARGQRPDSLTTTGTTRPAPKLMHWKRSSLLAQCT